MGTTTTKGTGNNSNISFAHVVRKKRVQLMVIQDYYHHHGTATKNYISNNYKNRIVL